MSKKLQTPKAWKNTFFWIAGILFIIGIIGMPFWGGDDAIRDPGQKPESNLFLVYFAGAAIMLINGYLSHKLYIQNYEENNQE